MGTPGKRSYTLTTRTIKKADGTTDIQECIVVDYSKVTNEDRLIIDSYIKAGRVVKKRRTPGNGLTKKAMREYIEAQKDEELKAEFEKEAEANNRNYMKLKAWFEDKFPAYYREMELKEAEAKATKKAQKEEAIKKVESKLNQKKATKPKEAEAKK